MSRAGIASRKISAEVKVTIILDGDKRILTVEEIRKLASDGRDLLDWHGSSTHDPSQYYSLSKEIFGEKRGPKNGVERSMAKQLGVNSPKRGIGRDSLKCFDLRITE